jgi:hypothetical protein
VAGNAAYMVGGLGSGDLVTPPRGRIRFGARRVKPLGRSRSDWRALE